MLKVEIFRDIFFTSLLSTIVIIFLSYFGNISKQVFLKALQSKFFAYLSESLDVIVFNVSTDKLKSMTELGL